MSRKKPVYFGTKTLDAARERLGLTNQQVWEGLPCSQTTWWRWKTDGAVSRERLTDVVVFLDLDEPEGLDEEVPRSAWVLRAKLHEQADEIREQKDLIARMDARIRQLEGHILENQLGLAPEDAPPES